MKLNYECLRATLLAIESVDYVVEDDEGNISYEEFTFDNLVELMKKRKEKYSKTDIFYSVQNLKQAGYISASEQWADGHPRFVLHKLHHLSRPQIFGYCKRQSSVEHN